MVLRIFLPGLGGLETLSCGSWIPYHKGTEGSSLRKKTVALKTFIFLHAYFINI